MVLDARLGRLGKFATGQSAREAALAFSRSRHEKLAEAERARADEFEAILEAMFLMAAVDGEIAPDEIGQLAASVQAIVDTNGGKLQLDLGPAMDELAARLESLRSRPDVCLLPLGWGGGFLGKSAYLDTQEDSYRKILRNIPLYQRAIQTGLPFPKTRRVVFHENQPASLPGWVALEVF